MAIAMMPAVRNDDHYTDQQHSKDKSDLHKRAAWMYLQAKSEKIKYDK